MLFTLRPNHWKVSSVTAKLSGIAMSVMKVVRRLIRKSSSTTVTITAPSTMAFFRLPTALSMKSRWRNSTVASTPSGSEGWSPAMAASIFSVRPMVSKPGDFTTLMITPGLPFTAASPRIGSVPHSTFATSETAMGRPPETLMMVRAISSSSTVMARLRTMTSWGRSR